MDYYAASRTVQGFNRGVNNLFRIRQAKAQNEREEEKFAIDKKVANLQLKKVERDLDPEIFEMKKKALGYQSKIQEQTYKLNTLKINDAEKGAKQTVEASAARAESLGLDFSMEEGGVKFATKKRRFGGGITFPQDINIRQKISTMLLDEGSEVTEQAISDRYAKMYGNYSGVGSAGGGGNNIPVWVPQGQEEAYTAAMESGYQEEEIKAYLGA